MNLWRFLGGWLTIIPANTTTFSPWTITFFPIIGSLLGGFLLLLSLILPLSFAGQAVCIVAVMILFSGALHVDGWADTFDALGGDTPEKRYAILKDPHLGVYGTTALVMLILFKIALLTSLLEGHMIFGLVMTPMVSRWAVGFLFVLFRPAKEKGFFASLQKTVRCEEPFYASLWMLVALGCVVYWDSLLLGVIFLLAMMMALVSALLMALWQSKRLEGITGDTCGASMEIAEVVFLMFLGMCSPLF